MSKNFHDDEYDDDICTQKKLKWSSWSNKQRCQFRKKKTSKQANLNSTLQKT